MCGASPVSICSLSTLEHYCAQRDDLRAQHRLKRRGARLCLDRAQLLPIGVLRQDGELRLTRAGAMMIDRHGNLITAQGHQVVDAQQRPIKLTGFTQGQLQIDTDGSIYAGQDAVAKIGLFESTDPQLLKPIGGNLFKPVGDAKLVPASGRLQANMIERANVDPTVELTRLMETQRLLEANANMIKYQDQALGRLVTEVGKIS